MRNLEKTNAAKEALKYIKDNTVIGLGSGSTMAIFVKHLAKLNLNIKCIPTSKQIEKVAGKHKLKLVKSAKTIHIAVDGADQIDKNKNLLKGAGALAFIKEKEIDYKAEKVIIIADRTKLSKNLNKEVLVKSKTIPKIEAEITKRVKDIYFLKFKRITNPKKLEKDLNKTKTIIENGIFANFRKKPTIIIGTKRGAKKL